MTKYYLYLTAVLTMAPPVQALADITKGEALHQKYCQQCHDSQVYTRNNHFITNLQALNTRVRFCEQNLGLKLFDDEVNDLVEFLNQRYYHFTKPSTDKK